MASGTRRKDARKRQQQRAKLREPSLDVHGQVVLSSIEAMERLVRQFADREDPAAEINADFRQAVDDFAGKLEHFDPIRLIEVARITYLPFAPVGMVAATPEASAAHVELMALLALSRADQRGAASVEPVKFQAMSEFTHEAKLTLEHLPQLAQLRALAETDPDNRFGLIETHLRGSQVWMRNSSYPVMAQQTVVTLLDGDPDVRGILMSELGFDAGTAMAVLEGCHDLQQAAMNDRMIAMRDAVDEGMSSVSDGSSLDPDLRVATVSKFEAAFEPGAESCTVSINDLADHIGVAVNTVSKVVEQFRVDIAGMAPVDVVDAFMAGNNPLRTRPIVVADDGRIILPHNALNADAVKENLEVHLKVVPSNWAKYDLHRGKTLERRTTTALSRMLPGASQRDGVEYYVPANEQELQSGDPATYTKRVESDHLILVDDVAFIVEDKAVALSALSKGGKTNRIRTDLTNIITKAAEQSGRLRDAIERDGGVRVHGEGWVDLGHVREIHTIAVSLDDLSSISTATAELVRAGLLDYENIPWTVSIHDLELIVELVERPADFLLYLRRRTRVETTVMFSAPDELDLFLYFYENGLWVEPNPEQVREAFPFLPAPTAGELRRYREQLPMFITSRTDALDSWFYTKDSKQRGVIRAPKPKMVESPFADLVDDIQARGVNGWLSIGATLLEGSTAMQHKLASNARDLLNQPTGTDTGRNLTVPLTSSVKQAEGWLLVWATRPVGVDPDKFRTTVAEYLRTKKHQLSLPRGAVFLYDEGTHDLVDVVFDGRIGELDAHLSAKLSSLRPASALQNRLHPNAKKAPMAASPSSSPRPKAKAKAKAKRRPRPPKSKRRR